MGAWLLAAASAQAFVAVVPRTATLLCGRTRAFQIQAATNGSNTGPTLAAPAEDWSWRVLDGGVGTIDEATGVYAAPAVDRPCPVTVQATCRQDPVTTAEMSFLVLPAEPFKVMASVLGEDCLETFSTRLPFLDPAARTRFDPQARVKPSRARRQNGRVHLAGYGLPFTVQWRPQGTHAQLLSYGLGHGMVRREVTGEQSREIIPTDRMRTITVESLQRAPDGVSWESIIDSFTVQLRGLVPHAGNPLAGPVHQDGPGVSARFREPFGVVVLPYVDPAPWISPNWFSPSCLVTDPQSHVIRLISHTGQVSTPWGEPDRSGHLDTSGPTLLRRAANTLCGRSRRPAPRHPTRFHGPTFLTASEARLPNGRHSWLVRVADSGNHVIRELHEDGTTTTLAGSPGVAGHLDSFLGLATPTLFSNPQGLAEDDRGNLYVADQGNCVIRVVSPRGRVRTLAGIPNLPGSVDGPAATARFSMLRGLAMHRSHGQQPALFAADGHAIRRIDLEDGQVTTLVGVVDTPGFRDVQDGTLEQRREAIRQPCLNQPCGLVSLEGGLMVADQGNHALRVCWNDEPKLMTLAGAPELGETRWGLLRDAMPVGLDERFAALEAPRGISAIRSLPPTYFVTAGRCVAELLPSMQGRDRLAVTNLACPLPVCSEQACPVRITLAATSPEGLPSQRPVSCTVDFLDAQGTLVDRKQGDGTSSTPVEITGAFTKPGTGAVIVRCTTDQGVSTSSRLELAIAP
jgi:hypothetical protein